MPVYPAGVTTHALLTDVNTPHLLAELEAAVCSETEALAIAVSALIGIEATVALFQANAATGTFTTNPERINNNDPGLYASAEVINQYAEVDFGKIVSIRRWRQYGNVNNNGDGVWKIERYNLNTHAWVDWVTGISTRTTSDWSDLSTETEVVTDKIRLVVTTLDSIYGGRSHIGELEVIY